MHVGPHKTGTTTIQNALQRARPELPGFGVVYPGRAAQHFRAALAVSGRRATSDKTRPVGIEHWTRLVDEVRAAGDQRVVISSEFFSEIDEATGRRVLDELGDGRPVHVVVTLRPLGRIMPSAWQQFVRNRMRYSYERWLDIQLNGPAELAAQWPFWLRHRHDDLVRRWSGLAGAENVTVVVLDESDHQHVLRVFEQLVGLPEGRLVPDAARTNRSLTLGEVELVRHLNLALYEAGVSAPTYRRVVTSALVPAMQGRVPDRAEARIVTPRWALERARERDAETTRVVEELGVRVAGRLSDLAAPLAGSAADDATGEPQAQLGSAAAAQVVLEALRVAASGIDELAGTDAAAEARRRALTSLPATELLGTVAARARRRLGARVRSLAARRARR